MRKTFLALLTTLLGTAVLSAAEFEAASRDWENPVRGVTMTKNENTLEIAFTADKFIPTQHANWLFNRAVLPLRLREPIALNPDAARILFEASGHEVKTWNTKDESIQLWPVIRDMNDELLAYIPQKFPHIYAGATTWATWMTPAFACGEAGGATTDIYTAVGGDGNAWPDGKLEFIGFNLVIQTKNPEKPKSGKVTIGKITIPGKRLPVEAPYFYADSLCKKAGEFTFSGTIASGFQTQPIAEFSHKITFDPASVSARRQKVSLPVPEGNGEFWCSWLFTDADGKEIASNSFRHQVTLADFPCQTRPLPVDREPVLGFLRINPDRPAVYKRTETPAINFRVWGKGEKTLKITAQLLSYQYADIFEEKEFRAEFSDARPAELVYTPNLLPGRDAYRCRLIVKAADGKVLQSADYVFGRQSDLKQAYRNRTGSPVNRHELKDHAYNHATFHILSQDSKRVKFENDLTSRFAKALHNSGGLCRYWVFGIDPAEMEILPGVYDFAVLDKILDLAWDAGVRLTLRVTHIDSLKPYKWLPYSAQHNFDGLPIHEHYYGGYSLADSNYLECWHRLNRALFDRYGEHPGFNGYFLLQPAGEFTMEDKPYEGIIAGYEPPMRGAFQRFLRDHLRLSLDALNRRWHTRYQDWKEIEQPRPDFSLGQKPDLSPQWADFNRFKGYMCKDVFFPEAVRRIREYTDRHVIILYSGFDNRFAGQVDYFHNGGNDFLQGEGEGLALWRNGKTGWISEPHDPTRWESSDDREWNLDWTTYLSILQAGGGGTNLHVYYYPRPLIENYGYIYAYDRLRRFHALMEELHAYVPVQELPQLGFFQDKMTLYCKHKTTFSPRLQDLRRFFELVKMSQIPFSDVQTDNLSHLKLLVLNPLDEVFAEENVERVAAWVKQGGKVILSAQTGKYTPAEGLDKPFALLRALGITPPGGKYRTRTPAINAQVSGENPFFAAGREITFYTCAQYKKDLQSPEIKKEFWKFPYRWIPETDYFGYYPQVETDGEVLARFPDNGAALTLHNVGKGAALVFWGVPDYRPEKLQGFIANAARWAGIKLSNTDNPIAMMQEGKAHNSARRYALLWHKQPGTYQQRINHVPDGEYFVEDLIAGRKYGWTDGATLRGKGLRLDFPEGASPLQVLRFSPKSTYQTPWAKQYGKAK